MKRLINFKNFRVLILLGMCALLAVLNENFFTVSNLMNILRQTSVLAILSFGMTFVILTGGIDLSIAGIMSLAGCVCAILLNRKAPVPVAILEALLVGAALGGLNGLFVAFVDLPPFVATYGVKFIADGLALILMGGSILYGFPASFKALGVGFAAGIPMLVILSVAAALIFYVVLSKLKFGKQVYCVGANPVASFYSGIRPKRILVAVYVICGICAGVAGILQTARMNAAQAGMGDSFQMLAITSVVIGGTSMAGGEGGIPGTIVGALILTLIVNGMNLLGIPSLAQSLITGLVIILAVMLDVQMKKVKVAASGSPRGGRTAAKA